MKQELTEISKGLFSWKIHVSLQCISLIRIYSHKKTIRFFGFLFIYFSEYYPGKRLSKVATIMIYLLSYLSLTQETSGNHSRAFFKTGRCRMNSILDFKDKPTFPGRCLILISESSRKPFRKKTSPA